MQNLLIRVLITIIGAILLFFAGIAMQKVGAFFGYADSLPVAWILTALSLLSIFFIPTSCGTLSIPIVIFSTASLVIQKTIGNGGNPVLFVINILLIAIFTLLFCGLLFIELPANLLTKNKIVQES